ncbi:hypothetical protein [Citrobacter werkmanii]|uniref:hypothetical protein n=1 Tax=Citrobacter werkmanii TaxID=67827 RepID=UPI001D0B0EAC|nr:hypothetical protein [Citrobacter werkmanii]MBY6247569.1 hypothetical protein [Citrobacter werkmanii]MBY6253500.1 hypothetical protein [Citrobacter werkmanii]
MTKRVISTGGVPTTVPSTTDVPVAATTSTAGTVKQMAVIADLTAAPTQADFNGLLAKLRTA